MPQAKVITETVEFWMSRDRLECDCDDGDRFGGTPDDVMFWNTEPRVDADGNYGHAIGSSEEDYVWADIGCSDFRTIMKHLNLRMNKGAKIRLSATISRPETAADRANRALKSSSVRVKDAALKELLANVESKDKNEDDNLSDNCW